MIVFDKRDASYTIIVTVSEKAITEGNELVLKIQSRFSNVNFSILLPSSVSPYPARYDKFIITEFEDYPVGVYSYAIVERNPSTLDEVQTMEVGLLKVIDEPAETFTSINQAETSDDFLVLTS